MSQGDIAVLGIKVESGEAVSAADDLDKLAKAGERAEVATGSVGVQAKSSGVSIKDLAVSAQSAEQAMDRYARQAQAAGMSTKAYTSALRGVPAQFTDIAVSLQGGMNPFTVLLQQGGQLKDMFGGVGPAARALGGYIIGLVNPYTVLAAAVAGVGVAYYKGSQETEEFRNAVVSGDVVDVFEAVGLDKPNIGLLDDEFLAEVRNLPEKNLAVELLERLLEGEIKSKFASNLAQEKKFSELLDSVIKRYQNRSIETAQVIEELIEMAKKFAAASKRGDVLGLNDDELAFYDALANNEASVRELGDEVLAKIAHELTDSLRQNVTVDWSNRDSVRAKLRLLVKRILRKYKYPPDQQEEAAQLVLAQAETLCEAWM